MLRASGGGVCLAQLLLMLLSRRRLGHHNFTFFVRRTGGRPAARNASASAAVAVLTESGRRRLAAPSDGGESGCARPLQQWLAGLPVSQFSSLRYRSIEQYRLLAAIAVRQRSHRAPTARPYADQPTDACCLYVSISPLFHALTAVISGRALYFLKPLFSLRAHVWPTCGLIT